MIMYQGTGQTGHIFQSDSQTITNLVLKAGATLTTHHAPYTVVVVPVKGRIVFGGPDENFQETIYPGVVVRMQPNEPHNLHALEDSELMVIKSVLKD